MYTLDTLKNKKNNSVNYNRNEQESIKFTIEIVALGPRTWDH